MREIDLRAQLPAGEWADVQVLPAAGGMMADNNWGILGRARWLRQGGREAFLKLIVPAGSGAGERTELVTGNVRLQQVRDRLVRLKELQGEIPCVPILHVSLDDNGLLVAMEEVKVLQDLIEAREARHLACRLLRDLDPGADGHSAQWLHFDICPKNIGVVDDDKLVFLDLESLYVREDGAYAVSVPAWKPFRAPLLLKRRVLDDLARGLVSAGVALEKMRYEVILAAAECLLGPLPTAIRDLDRGVLERWGNAAAADPAAAVLVRELLGFLDGVTLRAPSTVAAEIDGLADGGRPELPPPSRAFFDASTVAFASTVPVEIEGAPPVDQWLALQPTAHALRAGSLNRQRVAEYRDVLQQLARAQPLNEAIWEELMLVLISYEKDSRDALAAITEAVAALPQSRTLAQLRDVVASWARERRS